MGIIFFAPWCMHHWASIITNASSHMQHSIVHWTFYHRVAPALQSCNLGVHHYPPSSICTMGEPFYLYSLVWWHCTGIKKHVLCNSSDNIILSKDIPKTPPKPFFRLPSLVNHEPCDESQWHLLSSCCDLCAARVWLPCLSIIPCFVWPFLLEQKILHHSIIYSTWKSRKNWVRMFLKIIVVIRRRPWLHVKNGFV